MRSLVASVAEVAGSLGLSQRTIRRWIRDGWPIPHAVTGRPCAGVVSVSVLWVGHDPFVVLGSLHAWLERCRVDWRPNAKVIRLRRRTACRS